MATTILGSNYIQFGSSTFSRQFGDNFGYIDDAISTYGFVEGVWYQNTSGRTQVFYVMKVGNSTYPTVEVSNFDYHDATFTGFAGVRNNLTYIVPQGYYHRINSGGTLLTWTGNLFNE